MTQQELIKALEPLVDQSTVFDVLLALARLCNEKAEHIRENWQDNNTARSWDRTADTIDRIVPRIMC